MTNTPVPALTKRLDPPRPPARFALACVLSSALLFTACSSLDVPTASVHPDRTVASAPRAAAWTSGEAASSRPASTTLSKPTVPPLAARQPNGAADPITSTAMTPSPMSDDANLEGREAIGVPTDPLRPDTTLNLADVNANRDLWGRIRQGFALPMLESDLVAEHERWYASRPDYVQRMTDRASRYLFHVVEEIERRQMPTELALLPFIESAFNPQAQSSARASGIWQFMPATGKDFELKQNLFRDDRRDVLASTRAAMDYLQRLHRQFGDWHLALAAYNWGEGNVQRAISRNLKAGLPTDYLSLNMPPETRNYVPKLHAVKNIVARPETFNLTLTPIENHPYFVSVPIQRDIDAVLAARLAGLPVDEFKALNPSQNKPVILAAGTPQLLLPYDNASLFVNNMIAHKGPLASWTAWVVPRTMRPTEAARQTGMSESALRDINRIPPKMLVKAGSALLVPRPEHREQDVSESLADNAMMALAPDLPPLRRMSIKAGKRDTVQTVARRYRVSPQQVAQWNRVSVKGSFARGQSVVIFVPFKANTRSVSNGRDSAVRPTAAARTTASPRSKRDTYTASSRTTRLASSNSSRNTARATKGRSAPARSAKVRVASYR